MSRRLSLPYHTGRLDLEVPDDKLLGYFEPTRFAPLADVSGSLERSLRQPLGAAPLRQIAAGKRSVAIVIDDATRAVPNALLLDATMSELRAAGIDPGQVIVLVATGLHRKLTEDELRDALGPWHGLVRVENHDADDENLLVSVGTTSLGTRLRVNRLFVEAELRILTGDVEHHQFCGYGGGAKSILPGLADRESIRLNHSRMDWPGAGPGRIDGNPVRREIDEAAEMAPVHFLLAVVLDPEHRVVSVHAGDLRQAFRSACLDVDRMYRVRLPGRADLVVASPGGHPKDASFYQSQKALEAAIRAVRPGGDVALAAACPEGSGSALFEQWMEEAHTPQDVVERIKRDFVMGGHKAYQVARGLKQARVHLYSMLSPGKVRCWFMHPLSDWSQVARLVEQAGKISVLPHASMTLTDAGEDESGT